MAVGPDDIAAHAVLYNSPILFFLKHILLMISTSVLYCCTRFLPSFYLGAMSSHFVTDIGALKPILLPSLLLSTSCDNTRCAVQRRNARKLRCTYACIWTYGVYAAGGRYPTLLLV